VERIESGWLWGTVEQEAVHAAAQHGLEGGADRGAVGRSGGGKLTVYNGRLRDLRQCQISTCS
jgi:hypothetical protein